MDWRKHISALSQDIVFHPPAQSAKIVEVEKSLGLSLPDSLKSLWKQSNGLSDQYGAKFIWPCEELIEQNMTMQTGPGFEEIYMPFDSLLFFGEAGNGDLYFFPVLSGKIRNEFTFRWDHESDSRIAETFHLVKFIENYITNELE